MLPAHGLGCMQCWRPTKGHAIPYSIKCLLAPIREALNNCRDILPGKEDAPCIPEAPQLHSQSISGKPEDPMAELDMIVVSMAEQGPEALLLAAPATTASLTATTATMSTASITTMASMECALTALSTRLGQQGEERAKDRCHIKEVSLQLTKTSDQLVYIRKVLDHVVLA